MFRKLNLILCFLLLYCGAVRADEQGIGVALLSKEFRAADFTSSTSVDDLIIIKMRFDNHTGQDVRAFQGAILFTDILDNPVATVPLVVSDPIANGKSLKWDGQLEYKMFDATHKALRLKEQSALKVVFRPNKILFASGESKTY